VRSQVYEEEDIAPARRPVQKSGGGCLPWFIAGMSLVMIAVLVVAGYVLLNSANTGPATRPVSPTSQPAVQPTTVSAAKVRVPNVVNRSQTDAEKLIKDINLEVGEVVQEFNQGFPANAVIKTEPAVGTEVNPKTKIKLTISKGTELVRLLDYVNTNGDAAEKALKDLGFKVERTDEFSTVQDRAVIRTEPKGGPEVQISKGAVVKLFVSKGPAPAPTATPAPTTAAAPTAAPTNTPQPRQVAVPGDLIGKSRATAENTVRSAGLTFRIEEWDENDIRRIFGGNQQTLADALRTFERLEKGQVLGTDPPAGTQVPQGREILIAVKK
jgi:eukaryotic-like serine/threonine-protein kinase